MTQVQITPKTVNRPQQPGWNGYIIAEDGNLYGCPVAMLNRFAPGVMTTCEVSSYFGKKDGKQKFSIESIVSGAAPVGLPPKQNYSSQKNPVESEQIFTVALLKEWMGLIPVGDEDAVVHAINTLRSAYKKTFGSGQQRRDDMDDQVPY